ncbi:hypothetical protein [Streptomyces sp. NPDC094437]|uniref:hypothetical protein n=1 Tax=Streptomyces sp. NPDC094437 TaxID=3366060 RepID=UPI0038074626
MSTFPQGNFTIVNDETGCCVRVRLGRSTDVSDWKRGTTYLQTVTEKPLLELGEADNSPATVWWFDTGDDSVERRPFNQIVSYAVGEYQNIGRHCVWLYTDALEEEKEKQRAARQFADRLDSMPEPLRERLGELIPADWKAQHAKKTAGELKLWQWLREIQERARAKVEAELEAWETDEEPLSDDQLDALEALRERELEYGFAWNAAQARDEALPEEPEWTEEEKALREEIAPRYEEIRAYAEEFIPEYEEPRLKDLELERQAKILADERHSWHENCVFLTFYGADGLGSMSKEHLSVLRAYLAGAAEEGIHPTPDAPGARTGMYGSGASRGRGSTYRWVYDGTYIYGADSGTVPSERTYWTDDNGYLVGKNKGGPGQTWTIAPWTPTPRPEARPFSLMLTGLFGPIGDFLRVFGI